MFSRLQEVLEEAFAKAFFGWLIAFFNPVAWMWVGIGFIIGYWLG